MKREGAPGGWWTQAWGRDEPHCHVEITTLCSTWLLQGCQISDDTAKALSPEELEAKQMKHLAQSLLPRDVNITWSCWRQTKTEWPFYIQPVLLYCQVFLPTQILCSRSMSVSLKYLPALPTAQINCSESLQERLLCYVAHPATLIGNVLHRQSVTIWELNIFLLMYFLLLVSVTYVIRTTFPSSEQGNNTLFLMPSFFCQNCSASKCHIQLPCRFLLQQ